MKRFLGITKDGFKVFDRPNSHIDGREIEFYSHLRESLSKVETFERNFLKEVIYFDRVIDHTILVSTHDEDEDEIVYAKRPKRRGYTRLVKGRQPEESCAFSVVLKKAGNHYLLITAVIGEIAPPEPWDRRAFEKRKNPKQAWEEAYQFWSRHALLYEASEIIAGTETIECPWNKKF